MFLIAKIVRGRRLLQELEQQEKDEAAAALDAAQSLSQMSRRLAAKPRKSSPGALQSIELEEQGSSSGKLKKNRFSSPFQMRRNASSRIRSGGSRRNKEKKDGKALRQKTTVSSSVDSSLDGDKQPVRRTSSMPSLSEALLQEQASGSGYKAYDYEGKLNKMQRRALRFTWHRLQTRNGGKRVENVFEEVFDRLIRHLPQIRDMFTTRMFLCAMSRNEMASLRDHAKVAVKMIDLVIKNLDVEKSKRTDVGTTLDPRMIGRSHGHLRPYGMTGQYWEKLGETIIDVVLAQEAVRDLPGAGQAWVILTACLVDQMRFGFDENRNVQPACPKQSTVLHHATRMLHNESIDYGSSDPSLPGPSGVDNSPIKKKDDEIGTLSQGVRNLPFPPKLRKHHSVAEETLPTHSSSSSSSLLSTCPLASRGSLKERSNRSSPDQAAAIAIN